VTTADCDCCVVACVVLIGQLPAWPTATVLQLHWPAAVYPVLTLLCVHLGCAVLCCCRFESLERCFRWSNRPEQKPFQDDWVSKAAQAGGAQAVTSSMQQEAAAAPPSRTNSTSSSASTASAVRTGTASNGASRSSSPLPGSVFQHGRLATDIPPSAGHSATSSMDLDAAPAAPAAAAADRY
jgi:hypothetical protein